MSREVEFRGWDKDTKRWYYGSWVRLERVSGYAMSQFPEEDNRKHQENDFDDYIFFTEMNDWGLETKKLRATVDPKSVGQRTGIRDANGHAIYEGDYLHAPTSKLALEVKWLDGAFCLVPVHTHDREIAERWGFQKDKLKVLPLHTMMCASKEGVGSMEVIGNIYENPELISVSSTGDKS